MTKSTILLRSTVFLSGAGVTLLGSVNDNYNDSSMIVAYVSFHEIQKETIWEWVVRPSFGLFCAILEYHMTQNKAGQLPVEV